MPSARDRSSARRPVTSARAAACAGGARRVSGRTTVTAAAARPRIGLRMGGSPRRVWPSGTALGVQVRDAGGSQGVVVEAEAGDLPVHGRVAGVLGAAEVVVG